MAHKSTDLGAQGTHGYSVDWPRFAERLAAVLAGLEEDQFLVILVKDTNRFVQFAAQGGYEMRVETTSNSYLDESERLSASQVAALRAAGWHAPTGSPDESTPELDPHGSPNFFVQFRPPVLFAAVADLAVHTFSDILGVPHPGDLEYEASHMSAMEPLLASLGLEPRGD